MCLPTWVAISLEKSLPGMSSWGIGVNPALREGTKFPLLPCREGVCSVCAHAQSHCAPPKLPPHWKEWAAGTATVEQERGARKQELTVHHDVVHHIINPVEQENMQENMILCIPSSHIPVFQTSRNMKALIFSDKSISCILISTFTSEKWEVEDLL